MKNSNQDRSTFRGGLALLAFIGAMTLSSPVSAVLPAAEEMRWRSGWLNEHWNTNGAQLPLSFIANGRPAAELLQSWRIERSTEDLGSRGTLHTLRLTDPAGSLSIRCEAIEFINHPAVEWVAYIKNPSSQDSPLLAGIQALDAVLTSSNAPILHYARGAVCSFDDFQPLTEPLTPGARVQLQAGGGRSSSDFLPFFNLETPGRGIIVGLGWSGEWAAEFSRDNPQHGARVRAGQALTRLTLRPGEEIRTPRIALLFYQGSRVHGQNLWRRFVLDQHRPKVNGQPLQMPLFNGNWGGTSAAHHLANIQAIAAHHLPFEFYWIDAEWFGEGPWFVNPGNWQAKKNLYPDGFKPLSDALHQSGRKLLLWFEPERVCEGTAWDREHPSWLLHVPPEKRVYRWEKQTFPDWVKSESLRNQIKENDRLFNLADPQARQFLTEFISSRIREWGLDCYRHDANIAPLEFWRAADAPDRQGITEIRWVEGLYAFWDDLLRRHPHLIIDNCASGGRRIDLETLSRSVPLWRTDFPGDPIAKQAHTYGLSFWAPLNATGAVNPARDSDYNLRSSLSSSLAFGLFGIGDAPQAGPPAADFPFARAKAALEQYEKIRPYFLGDYYPLMPYSKAADAWLAWQFDRADLGEGLVQAFRRPQSLYESARLKLQGLESEQRYQVINLDRAETNIVSGAELSNRGLLAVLPEVPSAALITYQKVPAGHKYRVVASGKASGGYAAFPDVCKTKSGDLVCVYYSGFGHVSTPNNDWPKGGRIEIVRSSDNGGSWSLPLILADTIHDDRDPHIACLKDGTLLCNWFAAANPKAPFAHGRRISLFLSRSSDQGVTWSTPREIVLSSTNWYASSAPVRELADGTLIWGLYTEVANDHAFGATIRSHDQGQTWGELAHIGEEPKLYLDAETDVIQLKDGSLLAALRSSKINLHFAKSTDAGLTWSRVEPAAFPGHAPHFLRHSSGTILMTHRLPMTALHWSVDEGQTWQGPLQLDAVIGAYPSCVELPDGRVVCVYYEEGAASSIRSVTLRVSDKGVEVL